jgi:hypothetical protein
MVQETDERLPGQKWAYGIAAGFSIGLLLVAVLVFFDARRRTDLEIIVQETAVGDPITLAYDPRSNPGKEIVRWHGENYFLQTNAPINLPEADAVRVGTDDTRKTQLYQARRQSDKKIILVKVAANQFLPLTPR